MYEGLLHLHNFLRWVILIFLLLSVLRHLTAGSQPYGGKDKGFGLPLLIATHVNAVIGIYQWVVSIWGLKMIQQHGMGGVMKDTVNRFWAIEHPLMMLIAAILITIGYGQRKSKHTARVQRRRAVIFYVLALIVILLAVPWPFRDELIRRPWFPGMPLTD
jgi:hypothetical protein